MVDVSTARSLIYAGYIVSIICGVFEIAVLIMSKIGIIFIPIPIILMWWFHKNVTETLELVDNGMYKKAKDTIIVPAVITLVFLSRIGGLIALIGGLMLPDEDKQL